MLQKAFQKATAGRLCEICKKQIAHAFYQRHYSTCSSNANDDEIIFVDEVAGSSVPLKKKECLLTQSPRGEVSSLSFNVDHSIKKRVKQKKKMSTIKRQVSNSSTRLPGNKEDESKTKNENLSSQLDFGEFDKSLSKRIRPVVDFLAPENVISDRPSSKIFFDDDAVIILKEDSFNDNLNFLKAKNLPFFPVQPSTSKAISPSDKNQTKNSGKIGKGRRIRQVLSNSLQFNRQSIDNLVNGLNVLSAYRLLIERIKALLRDHKFVSLSQSQPAPDIASVSPQQNTSFSQVSDNESQINESKTFSSVHYSLEFFWKITLKVLKYGGDENSSVNFWGIVNVRYLLGLFTCEVEAQQLFLKIMLRTRKWLPLDKLKFVSTVLDLNTAYSQLLEFGLLEDASFFINREKGVESGTNSKDLSLNDCLNLLTSADIVQLCRKFKVNYGQNRAALIVKLLKTASQKNVFGSKIGDTMLASAVQTLGRMSRIPANVYRICLSIFTLYSPATTDTAILGDEPHANLQRKLLYELLQTKTQTLSFPAPNYNETKLISIYSSYEEIECYVEAKLLEEQMFHHLSKAKYELVIELGADAKHQLVNSHFNNFSRIQFYNERPSYLNRFSAAAVLVRCVFHHIEALQKLRTYSKAAELLEFLINSKDARKFCTSSRLAEWYDRLALIYDAHLKRKELALNVCLNGLADEDVGAVGGLALQTRAQKLLPKNDKEFQLKIVPIEPKKVFVEGNVVSKNLGDQRQNHFYLAEQGQDSIDCIESCSVEQVALHYFIKNCGFNEGLHAEGAIWHTVFGLICYDVIFDHSIPDVWLSDVQRNPCDLNSEHFFINRRDKFETIFNQILKDKNFEWIYVRAIKFSHELFRTNQNSEIAWNVFRDMSHVMGFLTSCGQTLIVAVFRRLVENYRQNRSGFPDLTLWNTQTKSITVVEVKGPNDRLSNKQRLWLDFFIRMGVEAVVCHVTAKNGRMLQ